jgi:hypothetical protein
MERRRADVDDAVGRHPRVHPRLRLELAAADAQREH